MKELIKKLRDPAEIFITNAKDSPFIEEDQHTIIGLLEIIEEQNEFLTRIKDRCLDPRKANGSCSMLSGAAIDSASEKLAKLAGHD